MSTSDSVRRGSCLCGNIQVELRGDPISSENFAPAICHCVNCQKSSGAAFAQNAGFLQSNVAITDEANSLRIYEDTNGIIRGKALKRGFCSNCGSKVVTYPVVENIGPIVVVCTGILETNEDKAGLDPKFEIFCDSQREWWSGLSPHCGTQKFAKGVVSQTLR